MNKPTNSKGQMRAEMLARRDKLSPDVRNCKSNRVCERLEHLVWEAVETPNATRSKSPCIAVYAAMRSEVDLQPFVDTAFERGWTVCFPCMVRDRPEDVSEMGLYCVPQERLRHARETFLNSPLRCLTCTSLASNGYRRVAPDELDVVVVPLVAFDDEGGRLGYGGGNYDRLLPLVRDDALVVGVAFAEQRVEKVPVEPHDQPLPCLVSA